MLLLSRLLADRQSCRQPPSQPTCAQHPSSTSSLAPHPEPQRSSSGSSTTHQAFFCIFATPCVFVPTLVHTLTPFSCIPSRHSGLRQELEAKAAFPPSLVAAGTLSHVAQRLEWVHTVPVVPQRSATAPFALAPRVFEVCGSNGRGGCGGTSLVPSDRHTAWASFAPVGAPAQKNRLADLLPRQVRHRGTHAQARAAIRCARTRGSQRVCKSTLADVGNAPDDQGQN